jgi:carbamoyl-phosphate synthase small subunit
LEARLILEDGSIFVGVSRGAEGEAWGEVIFHTGMTGYQEIITDPSSCGQILTMTFPLIGNYGINEEDSEARRPFLRGFIARELCSAPHNWRSLKSIGTYFQEQNVVAMDSIDTRALTRLLRNKGNLRGIITTQNTDGALLVEKAKKLPAISEQDLISEVTTPEVYSWENKGPHVVVLDLGLKRSIARALHDMGCRLTIVPATYQTREILQLQPEGLLLAGGPGDPRMAKAPLATTKELFGKIPMLGIGLGHQLLALGLGGKIKKLKFGHHGANYPVKDLIRDKVFITSQNHSFIVSEKGLPPGLQTTHLNLNDETIEGLREEKLKITTVQFHPETFPGPVESKYIFELFLNDMLSKNKR